MNRSRKLAAEPEGILGEILEHKRAEVAARRSARPLPELRRTAEGAPGTRGFACAIRETRPAVIAEIKRASPSEGLIRADFDPAAIARSYRHAGAACLSVLTDERFFMGSDSHLAQARDAVALPALRKDFIVDAYQVYESRVLGADCVLLIAAALEPAQLSDLARLAGELALDVLVEVHNRAELDTALNVEASLLGINNRDLGTFATSLDTTIDLLHAIPEDVTVVTESGIHRREDVRRLREAGVHSFLVGTAFMREADPGAALKRLFG